MKYKIGDRVRIKQHSTKPCEEKCDVSQANEAQYIGKVYTVRKVNELEGWSKGYYLEGIANIGTWRECELEGEEVSNIAEIKIPTIADEFLDEDTKLLVEAGILNPNLDLTETGKRVIMERFLIKNKKKIVASIKEANAKQEAKEKKA